MNHMTPKNIVIKAKPKKKMISSTEKNKLIYDKDFFQWTQDQSSLLKNGEFTKLDIDHLREEIESLGVSLQRALESYLANLLMHKLKILYQPDKHTLAWDNSIKNSLFQIKKLIRKNPSLKTHLTQKVS